ncbi:OmpH family outer membrane protein [Coraliomargarita algicola]|uniref:OmpH family outer membrane protein n=1 Tax=Coraliomargarita algicola TaxID=3092156 RepID=A0ABZ0RQB2_9BACT|nr:OmpH family outer membrane protein [Coraliomargarita sp. J2-16]WPJ97578.1 OmpH family outer membrane protein [Coraliomargarita sp. J2-16]
MKKITTLILASLVVTTGLFAQKTPVVGVVDVQRVLADYADFQAAVEKVKGSVAPVEEEMKKMQANIEAIVSEGRSIETKAKNPAASDEARAEAQAQVGQLQQKLQQAQGELQQFRQQAQQLAKQGQQEELAPLQAKAVEAVTTVAEDKGIDLVIPKNTVIYSSDALEISDAVIAVLNAGN